MPTGTLAPAAPAPTSAKDKLEARLLALCMKSGVTSEDMDNLADTGAVSIALLKNTVKDKDEFRNALSGPPFNLSGTDWATRLRIGALVTTFESASAISDVQVKIDAERTLNSLPPEVHVQEIISARAIFDKAHFELTDAMLGWPFLFVLF